VRAVFVDANDTLAAPAERLCLDGVQLTGKTLGFIGFGGIAA
jgi:phosphoglycerate dehydrogenase-like enzyme